MSKRFVVMQCDEMMELALVLGGVEIKACDFENDLEIEVCGRKQHDRAYKISKDSQYRIKESGKVRRSDRNRGDYKARKVAHEFDRSMRLYNSGAYDKIPFKNRRDNERYMDEIKNAIVDDCFVRDETDRTERVRREILDRTQRRVEEIREEAHKFSEEARRLTEMSKELLKNAARLEASVRECSESFA